MGLLGGSTKTTQKTDMTNLASWQQDYVKDGLADAQSLYNSQKGTSWYQGDLYAGTNDLSQTAINNIANYAQGAGATNAGLVSAYGNTALGQQGNQLAALQGLGTLANSDATASNFAAASQYASNPFLDSQITAANRDVVRDLTENQLPGVDRAAAASGNVNSSRAGVMDAILTRGAQDRMADTSAAMRSNAYQQGLSQASADRNNQAAMLSGLSSQYGAMGSQGLSAAAQGQNMTLTNNAAMNAGGQQLQADAQGQLDADYAKWLGNDTRQQGLLNDYMSVVGNSFGQNGTTTTKQSQSMGVLNGLMGMASSGLGMASQMKGLGLFGGA